tara:strand:- start:754 stop:1320 length:567 start_codon:yes stop_codon:yes gene_type:complete
MKCLIGLGNPGDQYINTKHNFGYWVVDSYLKKNNLKLKLGKGEYVFAKNEKYILAKTTTPMNNSGVAVKSIIETFSLNPEDVVIIYDDIDIPLGYIRFKIAGSSGGHRGIDSVIYHLHSENFIRLKMGIGTSLNMRPSEMYVLKPFPVKYNNDIIDATKKACDGLDFFLNNTIKETMNRFNRKITGEN